MYWLNNCSTGNRTPIDNYDKAIEILDCIYGPNYRVVTDANLGEGEGKPLPNVWWIFVDDTCQLMLTSCQPVGDVRLDG